MDLFVNRITYLSSPISFSGMHRRPHTQAPTQLSRTLLYDTNSAMLGLAVVFLLLRPLIFVFLFVIVMTILGLPFAKLKDSSR